MPYGPSLSGPLASRRQTQLEVVASRRSWRIGQTRPVKVVFMSYRNTLHAAGEPEKGRQSLFSWAEFLTGEAVKRRNGQAYAEEVKYIVGGVASHPSAVAIYSRM